MKRYTQQEINKIPFYMKDRCRKNWKPEHIGKLAILVQGEKVGKSKWQIEGIDFEIIG